MKEYTFKLPSGPVYSGYIEKNRYANNNRIQLELVSPTEGPIAIITTNLVNEDVEDGQAFIKSYSENQGLLEQMIAQGVISEPVGYADSGHVRIALCNVLI